MHRGVSLKATVLCFLLTLVVGAAAGAISPSEWKPFTGSWAVEQDAYVNHDNSSSNTNAYMMVEQEGEVLTYTFTIEFRDTTFRLGPAAGMHILVDNPQDIQRGNSYLIFQDSDFIRLYRTAPGQLNKVDEFPITANLGDVHTYKVEFNTNTGRLAIERNGEFMGEWTDPFPLKGGEYISLRTGATVAAFTDITVDTGSSKVVEVAADEWVSYIGDWIDMGDVIQNYDGSHANTNAWIKLEQTGTVLTYNWTVEFLQTQFRLGPAAGMHIMADTAEATHRGTSYLVFQDSDYIRVYKSGGGELPKVIDFPIKADLGDLFTYTVEFNTETGLLSIYRDGEFVGSWTDPEPLKSGQYVSLRTCATNVIFSDITIEMK